MKLQTLKSLKAIYLHETKFSEDLANNLQVLDFGKFQDVKCEAPAAKRSADILATRSNDILVVENQFGKGDYDHWGRLEAYAVHYRATIAVLVAEGFEDLMIKACVQRNKRSHIQWHLVKVRANSHDELFFERVVEPEDVILPVKPESEYSEFWEPVRADQRCPFSGVPVPKRDEHYISKWVRRIEVSLKLRDNYCYVKLVFIDEDKERRRERVMKLFPKSQYRYEYGKASKSVNVRFQQIKGGRKDPELWGEARKQLVDMGTNIYNRIKESGL